MTRFALLVLAPILVASPAIAQPQDDRMQGMTMPAETKPPQIAPPASSEPPIWTGDYAADHDYDPESMRHAREMMRQEMGGMKVSKVMLKLAEFQTGSDGDGYRWDGDGWFGGDIQRLVIRTEGEASASDGLKSGEIQALYSRAIGPYTDVQVGVREDFSPRGRTYATLGAQRLVPLFFDVEGAFFLSTKGEVLARAEGTYDLRLFQRVVLQPRVELNAAAQDTPETRTGSGLSNAEIGLRLRYEIKREFAPYIGVSWDNRFGKTADYWRADGEDAHTTSFVVGLSAFF